LKIPNGVIRSRKSKDRQCKGQKDKQWSTKHYTTRLSNTYPLITECEPGYVGRISNSCSTRDTRHVTVKRYDNWYRNRFEDKCS
jgi:23S rRNA maturation mini-RNase III